MIVRNVCLILIFSVSIVAAEPQSQTQTQPQTQTQQKPAPKKIDVDVIEKHIKDDPNYAKRHKDKYKKYGVDADLSVALEETIEWSSKTDFKVIKFQQLNPNVDNVNPFQKPIEEMHSAWDEQKKRFILDSGPARKDLVFAEAAAGEIPRNYYKFSFIHTAEGSKEIDPHLSIHP
jgi:hypothetical protein